MYQHREVNIPISSWCHIYVGLLVGPVSLISSLGAPEKAAGREFKGLLWMKPII